MDRNCKALELDKILELLAAQTTLDDAAAAARALTPVWYLEQARRLLDETDAAYRLMAGHGSPSFRGATDVSNALRRAENGGCLSLAECLRIAHTLAAVRTVHDWYKNTAAEESALADRFAGLLPNRHLEDRIAAVVLSEDEVADTASPTLQQLRRKIRAASARLRDHLDKMVRSSAYQKILQDPIVTIRDGRFVVPVKAEHRGEVAGLIHDTSSSGATVFIEPMDSVETNNELRVLHAEEKAEIERIMQELSAEIGGFADTVIGSYRLLVELDLIFAKARLAYEMKAVMPALADDGHLLLKHARHPLIPADRVVPITVELGGDFDTLVITGPNTGGKTVTLKTVGLLTLMAQCGMVPPVSDGSRIAVFRHVLADIGDEQSIEQSLSTFSSHMTNLIGILEQADDHSLVLTDELGAGTDPVEGAALATAILEHLRGKGARIVSTTHYPELKAYAITTNGVENGSCEFDVATLRPTYRLLVGVPGRSNAFAISEKLGMDRAVVDYAKSLVSEDDRRLEEVVASLEDRRKQAEDEWERARTAHRDAEQVRVRAEEDRARSEAEQEKEQEQMRRETRRIIDRARTEAEQMMAELDAIRKQKNKEDFAARSGEAKSRLRARLNAMEDTLDPVTRRRQEGYTLPRPLKAGDPVRLMDIDKLGVVLAPVDKNGMVEVQAGVIRTRVPQENLRLVDAHGKTLQKGQPSPVRHSGISRVDRAAPRELDLRGMTVEEALLETDRFIDAAVLAGLSPVTLIHGKGTGALRGAIQAHLKRHPSVASYRLGRYGEGEDGVTLVEIK